MYETTTHFVHFQYLTSPLKRKHANRFRLHAFLSRYLPGSKTPISKFSETKEVRWGLGCPQKPD
ncbi:hypothetical protein FHY73_03110 [Bacillus tropicus]|nr:hypothetical protein FHY73_03110 [Bacillus tropicus]